MNRARDNSTARNFQDVVVGACGEAHPAHRHFERPLAGIVKLSEFADRPGRHARVVVAPGLLNGASPLHASADFRRGLGVRLAAKFLVRHRRDLDVDVGPVEQRS